MDYRMSRARSPTRRPGGSRRPPPRGRVMVRRVRVGVIGVGRTWRTRYRPALTALHAAFDVAAVTDPCPYRAWAAARRLGCPAAAGVLELLDRSPEAVLVLGRPWYGLWAAVQACRRGLPVFCGPPAPDDPDAEAVARLAQDRGLPVMTDLLPRLAPAAERLAELLNQLGT